MDFQRNRLVLGGIIGLMGCIILFGTRHQVWGTLALLLGFISSVRAIFNGAPIIGIILTKATGILIIILPMLWVASENFAAERAALASAENKKTTPPAKPISPKKEVLVTRSKPAKPEQSEVHSISEATLLPIERAKTRDELIVAFVQEARELEKDDDLKRVVSLYAEEVQYFGSTRTRNQIEADKARYWKDWPIRQETITSSIEVLKKSEDMSEVKFQSHFRNENPIKDAWISADLSNRYLLRLTQGRFFVVEQSCEVSNLEKSGSRLKRLVGYFRTILEIPEDLPEKIVQREETTHPQAQILALEAVNNVRLTLLAEADRDLENTMKAFAYQVRYFEKDLTSEAIRTDKQEYFEKWPIAEDEVISDYKVLVSQGADITINVTTRFKVTNALKTLMRSGMIDHTFKLAPWRNDLRITEQVGKVRNLETKELK